MGITRKEAIKILKMLDIGIHGKTREEIDDLLKKELGWFSKKKKKNQRNDPLLP